MYLKCKYHFFRQYIFVVIRKFGCMQEYPEVYHTPSMSVSRTIGVGTYYNKNDHALQEQEQEQNQQQN